MLNWFRNPRVIIFPVGLWVVLSIGTAVIGPFGTYDMLPFLPRLAYWTLVVWASIGLDHIFRANFPAPTLWHYFLRRAIYVLFLGVFVNAINSLLFESWVGGTSLLLALSFVFVVAVFVEALALLLGSFHGGFVLPPLRRPVEVDATAGFDKNVLLSKLPEQTRGALWHLESQDHYLRIVTDKGEDRILMRISDAVVTLPEDLGVQTHRSHWISHQAIRSIHSKNGKHFVRLCNDTLVPVSRGRLAQVLAAVN